MLSFDDCFIIGGILFLFNIFGIPSSANFHDMINAVHLSISILPPDVKSRYSHVLGTRCVFKSGEEDAAITIVCMLSLIVYISNDMFNPLNFPV